MVLGVYVWAVVGWCPFLIKLLEVSLLTSLELFCNPPYSILQIREMMARSPRPPQVSLLSMLISSSLNFKISGNCQLHHKAKCE